MRRCWHKTISESNSAEAQAVRSQHPEINYDWCKNRCKGYFGYVEQREECKHYTVREMAVGEKARESPVVNILNVELEFPV